MVLHVPRVDRGVTPAERRERARPSRAPMPRGLLPVLGGRRWPPAGERVGDGATGLEESKHGRLIQGVDDHAELTAAS